MGLPKNVQLPYSNQPLFLQLYKEVKVSVCALIFNIPNNPKTLSVFGVLLC